MNNVLVTLPQCKITAEEALKRLRGAPGLQDRIETLVSVKEIHPNDEKMGTHLHIFACFGKGEPNRVRISFKTLREAMVKDDQGMACNIEMCKKGTHEAIMQDVIEYFLKQITQKLKREQNQGRYISKEEFEEHRGDGFKGDWEKLFQDGYIGRCDLSNVNKMKRGEKIAWLTNKLMEGMSWEKLWLEADLSMQGLMVEKQLQIQQAVGAINGQRAKDMKELKVPPCPILPSWAPVAHADTLTDYNKKVHLLIYGPANTGKTSFVKQWAKDNNLKLAHAPRGGMQKFNKEDFIAADVILVDDLVKAKSDDGQVDENRINYSTLLNWCNGQYIISVYKEQFTCKPKIIIITTNEKPEDVMPLNNPVYAGPIRARFNFLETRKVDQRMDPDEGNIYLHYMRKTKQGPFAEAEKGELSKNQDNSDEIINLDTPIDCVEGFVPGTPDALAPNWEDEMIIPATPDGEEREMIEPELSTQEQESQSWLERELDEQEASLYHQSEYILEKGTCRNDFWKKTPEWRGENIARIRSTKCYRDWLTLRKEANDLLKQKGEWYIGGIDYDEYSQEY